MIENITKAYVALISIFGLVLIAGSLKSTMDPDEKVYAPGRYTAVYNSSQKTFLKSEKPHLPSQKLQANTFAYNPLQKTSNQCQ